MYIYINGRIGAVVPYTIINKQCAGTDNPFTVNNIITKGVSRFVYSAKKKYGEAINLSK